ncbi:hypothetical protein PGT21_010238 [Puccinia graminis f. sp. tritici]|uniref:Uncharacterized protein n=1 Tax=Puccinia graminis f. sp. tritici TaxID=56615 RepID=A0A5B0LMK7_PUCGR|nr:hypothetical protein PGT21_023083 [Puccinia graminis f. sp. tritici]KAA1116349.1 hypothetical protein PGT21_010238 [Puccinia graminis f. sp. tritici]
MTSQTSKPIKLSSSTYTTAPNPISQTRNLARIPTNTPTSSFIDPNHSDYNLETSITSTDLRNNLAGFLPHLENLAAKLTTMPPAPSRLRFVTPCLKVMIPPSSPVDLSSSGFKKRLKTLSNQIKDSKSSND